MIAVLVPLRAAPGAPGDSPIGRAALALAREGVEVVVGDRATDGRLHGFRPGSRWLPADVAPHAVWDRYPSQSRPEAWRRLREALPVPWANPPAVTALCRDKLATQAALSGLARMPEVEADPARFADALGAWGAGFLKPRHGAFGRGVRRVLPGDPLPARGEGAVLGEADDLVLQRAIPAPRGWAGVCVRALAQREGEGWVLAPLVARRDRDDPVVNVARSAAADAAEDVLAADTLAAVTATCLAACAAFPEPLVVELGFDLVVDPEGAPWLIEVNGRPGGRLEALARRDPARFAAAHLEAAARPLRWLAGLSPRRPCPGR